MKFYCIYINESASTELLRQSCKEKGLSFIKLSPIDYDYRRAISFSKKDLLYRVDTSKESRDLELFLINKKVTTLYGNYQRATSKISNVLFYEKENIPRPKTIYRLSRNKTLLTNYAKHLGLPLIIKAMGGSHGVGIIKVDSLSSLFSIADYLLSNKNNSYVMKEFINSTSSARLIVLNNKIIDSIEYTAPRGDFRSNEGATPNVKLKKFPTQIKQIALKAVRALDIEFAGVDVLIDKKGKGYIAEVNFPCFFPRAQLLTGKNISGMLIDHLIKKSKKKSSAT